MNMNLFTTQKATLATAFAYKYKHNPRNLENLWLIDVGLICEEVGEKDRVLAKLESSVKVDDIGDDEDEDEEDNEDEEEKEDKENENDGDEEADKYEEKMAANTSISTIPESNASSLVSDFSIVHFDAKPLPFTNSKNSTVIDNCCIPTISEVKRRQTQRK
jgi:hypothetical protein